MISALKCKLRYTNLIIHDFPFFIYFLLLSSKVMMQILKDMGITEYEPRVINQMLEFTYSKSG